MSAISLSVDSTLFLKALQPDDAAQLFAVTDANRVYLRQWLPWLDHTQAPGDTLKFIEDVRGQAAKNEALHCCIWFHNEIAGMISFNRLDASNHSGSVGYWLRADLQSKGIMTRSCEALIHFGFAEKKLHRIEIRCAVENKKSRAIPERLGFKQEGILRGVEWLYDHYVDHVVYGMLADDWHQRRLHS